MIEENLEYHLPISLLTMTLSCNVYLDQDLVLSRKQEIRSGERGYLAEILRKLLPHAKLHLNRVAAEYGQKRFSLWRPPPSWIYCKNFHSWVTSSSFCFKAAVVCQISSKLDDFSLNSDGVTPYGGAKYRCGIASSRFSTNKSLYLTNDTRYRHSYYVSKVSK